MATRFCLSAAVLWALAVSSSVTPASSSATSCVFSVPLEAQRIELPKWAHNKRRGDHQKRELATAPRLVTIALQDFNTSLLVGNVSLGSPPQSIPVEFNLHSSDFWVISAGASYDADSRYPKVLYNASASTTSASSRQAFTSDGELVNGHLGNDSITFTISSARSRRPSSISSGVEFGVGEQLKGAYLKYSPNSGEFGLGPTLISNSVTTPIRQILQALNASIVTLALTRTDDAFLQSGAILTLGGEDSTKCRGGSYLYTPVNAGSDDWEFTAHSACVAAVVGDTRRDCIQEPNTTVTLDENFSGLYVTRAMFNFIVNVTGATQFESGRYNVTCDLTAMPSIDLALEGGASLRIGPEVYTSEPIFDGNATALCLLDVYSYYHGARPRLDLGYRFLNRHCLALDYALASGPRVGLAARSDGDTTLPLGCADSKWCYGPRTEWYFIGNMSFGTPARNYRMYFSLEPFASTVWLVGKRAKYYEWSRDRKALYPEEQSATFTNTTEEFTAYGTTQNLDTVGYYAKDVINLPDTTVNITLGVFIKLYSYLVYERYDGIFGIFPSPGGRLPSALYQLLPQLQQPVMTLYMNLYGYSECRDKCPPPYGRITFGGEDEEHCEAGSYVYTPRVLHYWFGYYSFNVTGVSIIGSDNTELIDSMNTTLDVWAAPYPDDWYGYDSHTIFLHVEVADFIAKQLNASYDRESWVYKMDSCDLGVLPTVMIELQQMNDGQSGGGLVDLHIEEYIEHEKKHGGSETCHLNIRRKESASLEMGLLFFRHNCIAFNSAKEALGFAPRVK